MVHEFIPRIQEINSFDERAKVKVDLLRIDEVDAGISGNKWWKLKYNLEKMQASGMTQLVTFGGAFSNHIAATAAAGKRYQIKTTGIIRGEEHLPLNPTLSLAVEFGMKLIYCDRATYREIKKGGKGFDKWYGKEDIFILPEGGSNELAVKGCSEILDERSQDYDVICCPVGTGGTLSGLIIGSNGQQEVIGFSALKGGRFLNDDIRDFLNKAGSSNSNWTVEENYHRGGFAKVDRGLFDFVKQFRKTQDIQLDYIYNGKMMMGLTELINSGRFKSGTKILAIHSGGVQGNLGIERRMNDETW